MNEKKSLLKNDFTRINSYLNNIKFYFTENRMKGSVDYILFMPDDLKEENVQLTSKPLREHSKLLQAAAAAPLWETLDVLKGDSILFLLNQSLLSSLRRHNEPHALLIYFTRRFLNKKGETTRKGCIYE